MDIYKTQLLADNEGQIFRAFRRKRVSVLFTADGKPIRVVTYKNREEYRALVEQGHTVRGVWLLVPLP